VTDGLPLELAFFTGVLGAPHCLGMCSGLAGGYFIRCGHGIGAVMFYHGTRILTYGVLGMAGALSGRVLIQQGGFGKGQGLLMISAGLIIVLLGLSRWLSFPGPAAAHHGSPNRLPRSLRVKVPALRMPPRPWVAAIPGAMNGLVPCSLTASMAIAGAATADPWQATLLMTAFGLGTLPTMAMVSMAGTSIGRSAQGLYASLAGLIVVVLGLWTLYEGWVFFDIIRGLSN
jgi:sulfite exporter TauE/SafE